MILYQLVKGRKRIVDTAQDVLSQMCGTADECISRLLAGKDLVREPETLRGNLCKLSKIVYDRRRKALCVSDASFAMIDAGRGLENLILLLYELETPLTPAHQAFLRGVSLQLACFRSYVLHQAKTIRRLLPPPLSMAKTHRCASWKGALIISETIFCSWLFRKKETAIKNPCCPFPFA